MSERSPLADEDHYPGDRAARYQARHQQSLRARLTSRREQRLLVRALADAGSPASALDLPCGTGRFWPAFAEAGVASLIAGDASEGMLSVAGTNRLSERFPAALVHTSAFDIALPDGAVEFAACLRFCHHLAMRQDRMRLLAELRRVARSHVAVSLWVDGNLPAARRQLRPPRAAEPGYGRRICRRRGEVEGEFTEAGFEIVRHYDVWPRLSMWRLYLLRIPQ